MATSGVADQQEKVTMAVLSTKLDVVIGQQEEMLEIQRQDHDRLGEVAGDCRRNTERIGKLESSASARTWETRIVELLLGLATGVGFIKGS